MGWSRFAHPFPRRLRPPLTDTALSRMAWNPSSRGPHPRELLIPGPFTPPGPPRMSATERQLLDAVLAAPDADEPRLRYAEWCDRQGDARGEFIRAQLGTDPEATDRAADLWAANRDRWLAPFAPWAAEDVDFRRGFAEAMSLSGRAFISISDGLFRTAPVNDVRLVAVAPYLDELAAAPNLARLQRLDLFGNRIGPAGLRTLAGSPHLTQLLAIDLSRNDLGDEGLRELFAAPWWGQLRATSLADNGLSLAAVRVAAAAGLDSLDLADNRLGPDLGGLLAGRFDELDVSGNDLGSAGVAALLAADRPFIRLALDFNALGDAGAEAVASSSAVAGVRSLSLRGNRIGPAGAGSLAGSAFARLIRLDLSANHLGDDGAAAILSGRSFDVLRDLSLASNLLTAEGVRRLAVPKAIEFLSLAWNPIGDAGTRSLSMCPDLAGLRELDLCGTDFGFAGAVALAGSPHLGRLRALRVGENPRLPADGVAILRERFGPAVLLR